MKPASFGLILSRNTMSVRIGNRAGLSNVIQSAQLAGFHGNISRTPALYLGTWEASPLDIASAYSVLPTGAYAPRHTSLTILRIRRASRASPSPKASAPSIPSGGEHNLFHPPAGLQARRHGRKNYRAGL